MVDTRGERVAVARAALSWKESICLQYYFFDNQTIELCTIILPGLNKRKKA